MRGRGENELENERRGEHALGDFLGSFWNMEPGWV